MPTRGSESWSSFCYRTIFSREVSFRILRGLELGFVDFKFLGFYFEEGWSKLTSWRLPVFWLVLVDLEFLPLDLEDFLLFFFLDLD